ncbi:hypothetical protein BC455_18610 [Vibrio harveyi]|uniref:YajG family lipoprotein n=1 Tax=Vibrio harveyi TaxID=669 RepID=UPI000841E4DF|nr:YajG family lipoprotein [Vibrio harveyi]ODM56873.1 hypothetical protein BC455_18610 [Vibrio harveyi]
MKKLNTIYALVLAAVISGCSTFSEQPRYEPSNSLTAPRFTKIKMQDAPLKLTVVDSRNYKFVAQIDDEAEEHLLIMESAESIDEMFYDVFETTFLSQGFTIKDDDDVPEYKVEIQEYNVFADTNDLLRAMVRIEISTKTSDKRFFKKAYVGKSAYQAVGKPTASDISGTINKTAQKVVDEIIKDPELVRFLANNVQTIYPEKAF